VLDTEIRATAYKFAFNFNLRRYHQVCNGEFCNPTAADGEAGFIKIAGLNVKSGGGGGGQKLRNEVACLCCSKAVRLNPSYLG